MTSLRKVLALFLAVLMTAGIFVLASCKEKEPDKGPVNEYGDRVGEYDFGGDEITLLARGGYSFVIPDELYSEALPNIYIAVYNRQKDIEKRFNVSMNMILGSMGDVLAKFGEAVSAGTNDYDIGAGHMKFDVVAATEGYMLNLKKLTNIDFDMDYWSQAYNDMWSYKNLQYWGTGDITSDYLEQLVGLYVNMDVFNQYHSDVDLGKLIDDGKWTMEKVEELAGAYYEDVNNDGIRNNGDGYGYVVHSRWEASSFAYGGGFTLTVKEGDKYKFSINSAENQAIYSKLYSLFNSDCYNYIDADSDLDPAGYYMFAPTRLSRMATLRDVPWEFSVVVMPKASEEDSYRSPTYDGVPCIGVISTLDTGRYDEIGAVLEGYASAGSKTTTPIFFENALQSNYSRNELTFKNLELIRSSVWIDWGFSWCSCINTDATTDAIDLLPGDSLAANHASVSTAQAEYESLFNTRINNLYNKLEELSKKEEAEAKASKK